MDFLIRLKKFFILCALFFLSFGANAQQNHFVYLQTENNQLFYLKLNGKVISSSSAGYLILPNLPDGTLQLTVGFPKNEFPEEKFDLSINNKNEGYLLKNLTGKGWVLFNLQSLAVIENSSKVTPVLVATTNKNDDAFSSLLANAVNDSSLFQHNNTEPIQQLPKQSNEVVSNDSITNNSNPLTGLSSAVTHDSSRKVLSDTVSNNVVSTLPVNTPDRIEVDKKHISDTAMITGQDEVNKILGVKESKGMDMIYTVKKPTGEDTIRIFIPSNEVSKPGEPLVSTNITNTLPKSNDSTLTITPTIIPPDYKASEQASVNDSSIHIPQNPVIAKIDSLQANKDSILPITTKRVDEPVHNDIANVAKSESEIIVLPQVVTSSEVNSDCSSFANDQDFLKVRKKMAASIGKESMVEAARKFFKLKCYSTEQIKNLSYLFLTEEGKYLFFDMAYEFTSDSNLYGTLQSQFQDPYYLNRFKAMIRK